MQYPKLYKINKTGTIQEFSISTIDSKVIVTWGVLGGKMQTKETVCSSCNIGKSNQTSPHEQALLEAQSKWDKKLKSGYTQDSSAVAPPRLPMKVKSYPDQIKNVLFPCISTPKLNGINGLFILEQSTLSLYSRGGNHYPVPPHLIPWVEAVMLQLNTTELNGELYIPDTPLQDIQSAVTKPNPLSPLLQFHIFDLPAHKAPFIARYTLMTSLPELSFIKPVRGVVCHSHDDINAHYDLCMIEDYEGTVIKNYSGLYTYGYRSSDQFKYKKTIDSEFLVLDYDLDKNGHPIYICQVGTSSFRVKRKGTNSERLHDASIADSNIGKWLTVFYECLSKDKVPLKPVGGNFRLCTTEGVPLE